jgi:hypothetical protein
VFLAPLACDGHDSGLSEGRKLPNARNETTTIHVRHYQIDEYQVGPKCGCNFQCLRPTIGYMHLVAEFFQQQAKCVRTVSVVINYENPKRLIGRRHRLLSSRQLTVSVMPKS